MRYKILVLLFFVPFFRSFLYLFVLLGREFMAALEVNVSLLQVDLTGNLIGMSETMKVRWR